MQHDYIRRVVLGREARVRSDCDSYDSGRSRPPGLYYTLSKLTNATVLSTGIQLTKTLPKTTTIIGKRIAAQQKLAAQQPQQQQQQRARA